MTQHRQKVQNR